MAKFPYQRLPYYMTFRLLRLCAPLLFLSFNAQAVKIVQLQLDYNNLPHTIDIELFDTTAPLTVANYLDYVTSLDAVGQPKYNGTFIYRNIPGFVLQTGGYTFRPPNPLVDALISPILFGPVGLNTVVKGTLSPVQNEFNLSNLRGTVAMAKIPENFIDINNNPCTQGTAGCFLQPGTGPDTASNEWFINLSDNLPLDGQNGGFTVFGNIIDDGLNIANEISTFPDRPFAGAVLGSAFTNLPVVNYDIAALPAVLQKNLVMITSISQINRPIIRFTPQNKNFPSGVDFNQNIAGDGLASTINVLVTNTGNEQLIIDAVNNANIQLPFTIVSNNCLTKTLDPISTAPSSSCNISLSFSPSTIGIANSSLLINYTSINTSVSYSATLNITGEGTPTAAVLNASITNIQFPNTSFNKQSNAILASIKNNGGSPLSLNSIQITGIDVADFSISNSACSIATPLLTGDSCQIDVKFTPSSDGEKAAILSIRSNGGDIDIPLAGVATIPKISVDTSITLDAQIGVTRSKFLVVNSIGTEDLTITSATITGSNSNLFIQENNCPDTANVPQGAQSLTPNASCRFLIKFTPTVIGIKDAVLTLATTDPNNPLISVTLIGSGDNDIDGVASNIEAAAPNNGDGNNDGIPDDTQSNVASIPTINKKYITISSDKSNALGVTTILLNVQETSVIPADIPATARFDIGLLSYSIILPTGDSVNVGFFLPADQSPDVFYKFGPTPDNTTPHWYDFSFDPTTGIGARLLPNATTESPTGVKVQNNFVLVTYVDGLKGDDDLTANGTIVNSQSGFSFPASSDNSSSGSLAYLPLIILLLNLLKLATLKKRAGQYPTGFSKSVK